MNAQPRFHSSPADVLMSRLPHPARKCGPGWRARCPACDDRKAALSFREAEDGRLLLYCFRGCQPVEVLDALGMTWADVMPPRHWPESPEERRQARRAIREAGWASALAVVALEAKVVQIAAGMLVQDKPIEWDDYCRLVQAVGRIDHASNVLVEPKPWRPEVRR